MIVEVKLRNTVENYKRECTVVQDIGYINLNKIEYVTIYGDVARICFESSRYVEVDTLELDRVRPMY